MDFMTSIVSKELHADIESHRRSTLQSIPESAAAVEWEDWDDEGPGESAQSTRMRLIMELEDVLGSWLDVLCEVATLRRQSLPVKPPVAATTTAIKVQPNTGSLEGICNMMQGLPLGESESPKKHKVIKSSVEGRAKVCALRVKWLGAFAILNTILVQLQWITSHFACYSVHQQASSVGYPSGMLAAIVAAVLKERRHTRLGPHRVSPIPVLTHIENPLFSLARAGLGMLSQGLGRYAGLIDISKTTS